ncbi:MAG: tetratricopeptide repeat protein [Geobacteraceae bacterium]|nr:tetratricopeptide repeat protein [Geobacteraceae bacterium]
MKNGLVIVLLFVFALSAGCGAMEASRKKASYHLQMGLSYLTEGNYTKALIDLTEAEKVTPDDPVLLNYLGQAYYFKKRFDLAEPKYLRAIELRSDYSEARNNLGATYLELQQWDNAIKQFTLVFNDIFYQSHDEAAMNLALAYYGKGDYGMALSLLRPVIANNPRSPVARLNLGRVYFADDKTGLAIEEFKKAIELNGNYANAHYLLAQAYLKNKELSAAKAEFCEVIRINPDDVLGQISKERLEMLR